MLFVLLGSVHLMVLVLQVDKMLDPLRHLDEDLELCVFDDYGRAYCTESPWNDPGDLQGSPIFVNPYAYLIRLLHRIGPCIAGQT